ncbi:MAG: pyridoxal phosphate-dependent aminotransferase [Crocinitomicaceae bacterium]|nr:pyridoxal phosphate-dependent aminotransferase [Crocinitomicaceae bacterium]
MGSNLDQYLSDRINSLEESATIAMSQKSREMKAQGIDVISLSLGEPDFNIPEFIKESAKKAIDDNYSKYMPVPGYQDLREAIVHKFKRDNNLNYKPSQVVVSTGAKQCIANIVLSLVNPGDEVIVPAPYWVTYIEIVKMAGGVPVIIDTNIDNDFKITAQQLEEAMTPKSKLMIYSTPCNPSGSFYSKEELESLANVIAKKKDFFVISDEIYELINFTGKHESLAQFDKVMEQVVTVNGVSKAFAMTGWRLGYMAGPQFIADACTKMQGQFTSGTCAIAQRATITALEADPSVIDEMKKAYLSRRDLVLGKLDEIEGVKTNVPEGAFYIFPDVSFFFGKTYNGNVIENASDLCLYLLQEAHVALVTGEAFGDANCVRISYAASEDQLIEACARIKEALSKLK